MRKTLLMMLALLTVVGIVYLLFSLFFRAAQMPDPSIVPPVTSESMDVLLQSLESELAKHDPSIIQSLLPGITPRELDQVEATLGQSIHPEMQALYRWHNGLANDRELFLGHGFWPLELAIQTNQELAMHYREKGFSLFMAHEKNWLSLFPDAAGDGYYYDPSRDYETGGVFYNFREAGYFRYFPSVKNLIKAIVECYQSGVYPQNGEPDFDLEERIMDKYGFAVQQ
jgi:hypothetical protein